MPAIARLLKAKGVRFATEVTFQVLDAKGVPVLAGRVDYFFRDPRNGAAILAEAKGVNLEALTRNQRVYIPLFEGEGATIKITSRKGGTANLHPGDRVQVRGENFLRLGRVNLKDFAGALEQVTTGAQVKFSFRGVDGVLEFFKTEADFDAYLAKQNLTRIKPPAPAKPPETKPLRPPGKTPAPAAGTGSQVTAGEGAVAAKAMSNREVVNEIARTNNLRVRKEGGFATIGGMGATVLLVGGAFLFIHDVQTRGLVAASKDFALGAATFKGFQAAGARMGMRVPLGLWAGLGLAALTGLANDQGARQQEESRRADIAMRIIHTQYPGVLEYVGNEYCLWPIGWPCIEVNSPWEVKDNAQFATLLPQLIKLLAEPWVLEALPKPPVAPAVRPVEAAKWPRRGRMAP